VHEVKEHRVLPIDVLYPHSRNYKQHPETQLRKLRASLERFGQTKPIVVYEQSLTHYTVLAGHGMLEAAKQLGYTQISTVLAPQHWTQQDALGYLLADNETSNDAVTDEETLVALLDEQNKAGYDLASVGSDEETLRQMLASLDTDMRDSMKVTQGRSYEADTQPEQILDGDGRKTGTTPEEYFDQYQNTALRQITLIYDQSEYARIMRIFAIIRKGEKLETNTDAVNLLLNQYVQEHELEDALC